MMKCFKKPLSLILSLFMILPMGVTAFGSSSTNDYALNWAGPTIQAALTSGIATGYPDGSFKPDQAITRAEYFALMNNAFKITSVTDVKYTDVSGNEWYAPVIEKAAGYSNGYPDGSIRPDGYISRQEAAAIFSRILALTAESKSLSYTDASAIAGWSKEAVIAAYEARIMIGYLDGRFKPEGMITRAEAVVAVDSCLKYKAVIEPTTPVAVSGINVSQDKMTLTAGGSTEKINVSIVPGNATDKALNWSSSDVKVATVAEGIVTPITKGTATITISAKSDGTKTAMVVVTVNSADQPSIQPIIPPAVQPSSNSVNLGEAGNYAILAKTGISSVPSSAITGNIGVSPIDSTGITGFSLTADATNVFSTSNQVTGKAYAANYAVPTSGNLTTAVSNMDSAYTDAAGRAANYTELYSGDISGKTLTAGVYKWGTGVLINTDLTLNGSANDVWIFQVGEGITQANGVRIILTGGAQAKNIFWQAADTVSIGTGAHFEGIVLGMTNISLGTNASINGRLLAQTAVTLDTSTVVEPK